MTPPLWRVPAITPGCGRWHRSSASRGGWAEVSIAPYSNLWGSNRSLWTTKRDGIVVENTAMA